MASWAEESMREAVNLLARVGRNDLATDLNRIRAGVDFEDLDILRCAGAEQIADGIIEASSVSELISFLSKLARAMNLTHCTLHVVSESATTNFSTRMLTTYPRRWISRYIDLKYFNVDPIVRACIEADRPFFWDCFDRSSPSLQSFWDDLTSHGIGPAGYTRPITTERGDRVGISVCSSLEPDNFRNRFARFEDDLFNLGIYLVDSFCRLASENRPGSFRPTDDQLGVLRALSMGFTETELRGRDYQFGSYSTLERSICQLFRTRTAIQAAIIAARIGLLAEAPLTKADILVAPVLKASSQTIRVTDGTPARRLARLRIPIPDQELAPLSVGSIKADVDLPPS